MEHSRRPLSRRHAMTDDPKLQMARRVAANWYAASESNDFRNYGRAVAAGVYDDDEAVQCALAAIEECTERAARLIDELNEAGPYEAIGAAKRLRSGDHLKGPTA